jgi:hypothetical protein
MTAASVELPNWTGDDHRRDRRMAEVAEPIDQAVQNPPTRAGGMVRHLERPSTRPSGGQDDATDLLTATNDGKGQLPAGRRAAYPADRAAQPLSPRPLLFDDQEVPPCW